MDIITATPIGLRPLYAHVLVPFPSGELFTYYVPESIAKDRIQAGSLVKIPFGKRTLIGVVWQVTTQLENASPSYQIKPLQLIETASPFSTIFCDFLQSVARYNCAPLGAVLQMALPVKGAFEPATKKEQQSAAQHHPIHQKKQAIAKPVLTESQLQAATQLTTHCLSKQYHTLLLDGVTGSGKTEVYFEAIDALLATEPAAQILVMLPEIVLTTQFIARFEKRFGFSPVLWHSSVTPAKRKAYLRAICSGEARLIVGARSALFLPYPHLRCIIVDEEHEPAYKQEDGVIYHARDMAVLRGAKEQIPVILASATPSLETIYNIKEGKYQHIRLESRYGASVMPAMHTINMRESAPDRGKWISGALEVAINHCLNAGKQAMLFLNRRGYAPLTLCRACGYRFECPDCTSWLVEHRNKANVAYLQCHHCGYHTDIPKECPSCHEDQLHFASLGPGVERLAEEVKELWKLPEGELAILTSDTTSSPKKQKQMIEDIISGKVRIIIGTQMIAKGHHFPSLNLVGIIDADLGMMGGDIRAAERSYHLLHQVAGRAGRESNNAEVFVQTYYPDSMLMEALTTYNRDLFLATELEMRHASHMPPFSKMASIILSGNQEHSVKRFAQMLAREFPYQHPEIKAHGQAIRLLGPAPAAMYRIRGKYRFRLLLTTPKSVSMQRILHLWLSNLHPPSAIHMKLDIDPMHFM